MAANRAMAARLVEDVTCRREIAGAIDHRAGELADGLRDPGRCQKIALPAQVGGAP